MLPFAEGPVTRLRREVKALVGGEEAAEIARRLVATGGGRLVETRVACVYFDAPGAPLARRARATPDDCVKVRVKSYHPDRSGASGELVLEVKRERGGLTGKERRRLCRHEVGGALEGLVTPSPGPLAPCVATSYRRLVFQRAEGWRLTLDHDLAAYGAGWALFEPGAVWPAALGAPAHLERRVVLELKLGAERPPAWLEALAAARAEPFSKFTEALARAAPAASRGA